MFYYNVLMDLDKRMIVQEGYTGKGSSAGTAGRLREEHIGRLPSVPMPGYAAERQGQERLLGRTAK